MGFFGRGNGVAAASLDGETGLIYLDSQGVMNARFCVGRGKGEKVSAFSAGDQRFEAGFEVVVVVVERAAGAIRKF